MYKKNVAAQYMHEHAKARSMCSRKGKTPLGLPERLGVVAICARCGEILSLVKIWWACVPLGEKLPKGDPKKNKAKYGVFLAWDIALICILHIPLWDSDEEKEVEASEILIAIAFLSKSPVMVTEHQLTKMADWQAELKQQKVLWQLK